MGSYKQVEPAFFLDPLAKPSLENVMLFKACFFTLYKNCGIIFLVSFVPKDQV